MNSTETPAPWIVTDRYLVWVGITQAGAHEHLGQPYFASNNLNNVRAVLDKLATYRGPSFASILDMETGSVQTGHDF